jgi:hypothetical protein
VSLTTTGSVPLNCGGWSAALRAASRRARYTARRPCVSMGLCTGAPMTWPH